MSEPAAIFYLSALRKRKRVGWVQEVKMVGENKLYRIRKRSKLSWIKESDVVMETKTEATRSNLDADERRDQTTPSSVVQTGAEEKAMEANPENVCAPKNSPSQIREDSGRMVAREDVRVFGYSLNLFPSIASSAGYAPSQGSQRPAHVRCEILPASVPPRPYVDRQEPGDSIPNVIAPQRLERNGADETPLTSRENYNRKRLVWRRIASGKFLISDYRIFISKMAEANDTQFFIRLASEIQRAKVVRKTKP